jgi:UDP-glucose 4-epimerase
MQAALGQIPAVPVYGTDYLTPDGSCIRDYVHVEDLADAHLRALRYLVAGGDTTVINVGTGEGSSVLEVVAAAKQASGVDFETRVEACRPGDPSAVYADNRRARSVLGWEPRYGLDDIVRSAWQWHSSHPRGYAT